MNIKIYTLSTIFCFLLSCSTDNKNDDDKNLLMALALATSSASASAATTSGGTVNENKTAQDIATVYKTMTPSFSATGDSIYSSKPSTSSPYSAGSLQSDFLADGLKMANFVRYLANLPYDLELDSSLNTNGQYGAVLMAASSFSHTPSQPSDMASTFYSKGLSATKSSNIGWGYTDLETSIQNGYMRDDDTGNMNRVGHRRWIINPPLKKIGFGFAPGNYSLMKVFDTSRTETVSYDYVAWPAKGNFPIEFFDSNDPWSISLNTNKYSKPSLNSVSISLTSSTLNKTWTLNSSDNTVSTSDEYFNVENSGYGISNCIIFRPSTAAITSLKDDTYTVKISSLQTSDGTSTTIEYSVKFFSMADYN